MWRIDDPARAGTLGGYRAVRAALRDRIVNDLLPTLESGTRD